MTGPQARFALILGLTLCASGCADRSVENTESGDASTNDGSDATGHASATSNGSASSTGAATSGATGSTASTSVDGASSSGEPPPASCLPSAVHGPHDPELSEEGLDVYAGCDGGYLIEHLGTTPMTTADDVDVVRDQGGLVLGFPGLSGVGTGSCCVGEDEACITLVFEGESVDVPALLEHLNASFPNADGLCFGFRVRMTP